MRSTLSSLSMQLNILASVPLATRNASWRTPEERKSDEAPGKGLLPAVPQSSPHGVPAPPSYRRLCVGSGKIMSDVPIALWSHASIGDIYVFSRLINRRGSARLASQHAGVSPSSTENPSPFPRDAIQIVFVFHAINYSYVYMNLFQRGCVYSK